MSKKKKGESLQRPAPTVITKPSGGPVFELPPITIHRRLTAMDVGEQLQWWLTDLELHTWWEKNGAGGGIKVGICDTGIDKIHATTGDLKHAVADMKDFTNSQHGPFDVHGHNTHVAGIIAAQYRNDFGVAGIAPECKLYNAKALGDSGQGSEQSVAAAIHWCCEQGCHIINLSLGSSQPSSRIHEAIMRCYNEKRIVFAAAGNAGGRDNVGYPAKWPQTFAVGAVNRRKQVARFSDRGPEVCGVGFGVEMVSLYMNGQLASLSGTSMATPFCTGVTACRLSVELKHGGINTSGVAEFRKLYAQTNEDLGTPGHDPEYGMGMIVPAKFYTHQIGDGVPTLPGDRIVIPILGGRAQLKIPAEEGDEIGLKVTV